LFVRWAARLVPVAALFVAWIEPVRADGPYAARTDDELAEIGAGWDDLSADDRRGLMAEVRARVAAQRDFDDRPLIRVQTERRYGRIVRRSDGSLLRIEHHERSVHYREMPADGADRTFGVGFEQRARERAPGTVDTPRSKPAFPVIPVQNDSPVRSPVLNDSPVQNRNPG